MDRFNTRPGGDVFFGGTYNAHALAISAGLATIEALEADDRAIHRRIFALGEQMRQGLEAIVDRLGSRRDRRASAPSGCSTSRIAPSATTTTR